MKDVGRVGNGDPPRAAGGEIDATRIPTRQTAIINEAGTGRDDNTVARAPDRPGSPNLPVYRGDDSERSASGSAASKNRCREYAFAASAPPSPLGNAPI